MCRALPACAQIGPIVAARVEALPAFECLARVAPRAGRALGALVLRAEAGLVAVGAVVAREWLHGASGAEGAGGATATLKAGGLVLIRARKARAGAIGTGLTHGIRRAAQAGRACKRIVLIDGAIQRLDDGADEPWSGLPVARLDEERLLALDAVDAGIGQGLSAALVLVSTAHCVEADIGARMPRAWLPKDAALGAGNCAANSRGEHVPCERRRGEASRTGLWCWKEVRRALQ